MDGEGVVLLLGQIDSLCQRLAPKWIKLVNGTHVLASAVTRWRMTDDGRMVVYMHDDAVGVVAESTEAASMALEIGGDHGNRPLE